ncbi:MAG: dTDP-4-dehydrorhamnose 3,5-epimerase family protein [Acidobacteria bacterium]|nr:dTDP-4-dehydrorhamnose 3,5-epimerase family protein [Acidobacteriota bacterium]MBU4307782.1 dTDP-4-dehydrorhamnose 3,5-epimerase family protein [Acidobacteriota bacterium]MCG2810389.1 dTDP-4-dehydrorhamnose 3,5-epimerase family protein [Candidatus Aminicenantes bacterium]
MMFDKGPIEGVVVTPSKKRVDKRGWLIELFRHDELAEEFHPEMGYVSLTNPGVLRGPHEHVDQADLFAWVGPGDFKVTLWDNRQRSLIYANRMECFMGSRNPGSILVHKVVVHCYRCISTVPGLVPQPALCRSGKKTPIDEIRHEDNPENIFVQDELIQRNFNR